MPGPFGVPIFVSYISVLETKLKLVMKTQKEIQKRIELLEAQILELKANGFTSEHYMPIEDEISVLNWVLRT